MRLLPPAGVESHRFGKDVRIAWCGAEVESVGRRVGLFPVDARTHNEVTIQAICIHAPSTINHTMDEIDDHVLTTDSCLKGKRYLHVMAGDFNTRH